MPSISSSKISNSKPDFDTYLTQDDCQAIAGALYPQTCNIHIEHLRPIFTAWAILVAHNKIQGDGVSEVIRKLLGPRAAVPRPVLLMEFPGNEATIAQSILARHAIFCSLGLPPFLSIPVDAISLQTHLLETSVALNSPVSLTLNNATGTLDDATFSFDLLVLDRYLKVEPTQNILEHLELDKVNKTVKVYCLDVESASLIRTYRENLVAKAMGLSSLGEEILASFSALVINNRSLIQMAKKLEVLDFSTKFEEMFLLYSFREYNNVAQLKCLRARVLDIVNYIKIQENLNNASNQQQSEIPQHKFRDRIPPEMKVVVDVLLPSDEHMFSLSEVLYTKCANVFHFSHLTRIGMFVKGLENRLKLPPGAVIAFAATAIDFLQATQPVRKDLQGLMAYHAQYNNPSLPGNAEESAWKILCALIGFSTTGYDYLKVKPDFKGFFRSDTIGCFPRPQSQLVSSFEGITLVDILDAGLKIVLADNRSQHLMCDGNEVKVYQLSSYVDSVLAFTKYRKNKIASAFGIGGLGRETLTSLACLCGRGQARQEALKLGILQRDAKKPADPDEVDLFTSATLELYTPGLENQNTKAVAPDLLASRQIFLHREIQRRKSLWIRFLRHAKHYQTKETFTFSMSISGIFIALIGVLLAALALYYR